MAVYTHLSSQKIAKLLASHYDLGALSDATPIAEGIENSNYVIRCMKDGTETPYILTLFEKRIREEDLPFYMEVMQSLFDSMSVPLPQKTLNGALFLLSNETNVGKPISIVSFLEGKEASEITHELLENLGAEVARFHQQSETLSVTRENAVGRASWNGLFQPIADEVATQFPDASVLIETALGMIEKQWPERDSLPSGVIHADLFPDNVFFENEGKGNEVSGIIDWYFACNDFYAYELAIIMNAWCFNETNSCMAERGGALMKGYESVRPLSQKEKEALPILGAGAALRFLLTRLHDWIYQEEGALVSPKDPKEYIQKLEWFISKF